MLRNTLTRVKTPVAAIRLSVSVSSPLQTSVKGATRSWNAAGLEEVDFSGAYVSTRQVSTQKCPMLLPKDFKHGGQLVRYTPQQQRHLSTPTKQFSVIDSDGDNCGASKANGERITTENTSDNLEEKSVEQLLEEACSPEQSQSPPEFPSDVDNTKYKNWRRDQTRHSFRPNVDPADTSILLFPGQGSQFVGMGNEVLDYPNVPEMFQIAKDILGYDLLDICLNGPKSELDKTVHCQPAIFVSSLAAVEKLKYEKPKAIENCISTSGFSIGELSALVFAGAMSFEEGLEVVKARAEAMQKASELVPSGMMTVFLGPRSKAKLACEVAKRYCVTRLNIEDACCAVANYLYPECKVIAGNVEALDFIEKHKGDFGLVRTKRLPVSGAFHTDLMKPAREGLQKVLSSIEVQKPIIPVHSNVDGHRHKHNIIGKTLLAQINKPVRWEQIIQAIYARKDGTGFPNTYEVGPGRQLGMILRMTNRKAYEAYYSVDV